MAESAATRRMANEFIRWIESGELDERLHALRLAINRREIAVFQKADECQTLGCVFNGLAPIPIVTKGTVFRVGDLVYVARNGKPDKLATRVGEILRVNDATCLVRFPISHQVSEYDHRHGVKVKTAYLLPVSDPKMIAAYTNASAGMMTKHNEFISARFEKSVPTIRVKKDVDPEAAAISAASRAAHLAQKREEKAARRAKLNAKRGVPDPYNVNPE